MSTGHTASSFSALATPLALPSRSTLVLGAAVLLVGAVFYATSHDLHMSQTDSFSSSLNDLEVSSEGGNTIRRFAFLGLGGFGLWCLAVSSHAARRINAGPSAAATWGLVFFVSWCITSFVWSDEPGMTLRRVLVLCCYCLGAVGLARRFSGAELMRLFVTIAIGYIAIGIAAELALGTFKPWRGEYRFSGTQHPNTTGLSLAMICVASFCWWRGRDLRPTAGTSQLRRIFPAMLFVGAFGFLVLTKSRTSAAGVLATLLFLWTLSTPLRVKVGVVLTGAWLAAIGGICLLLAGMSIEDDVSRIALMGREEQSESLTGRLPIWSELLPFVARAPVTGYGYDSFWTANRMEQMYREVQWAIREAHSSYIDLALSAGLVAGLALLAAIVLTMRRRAAWYLATRRPEHGFFLGLQLFCLINGLTESAMVMPIFVPFIACCGLAQAARGWIETEPSASTGVGPSTRSAAAPVA